MASARFGVQLAEEPIFLTWAAWPRWEIPRWVKNGDPLVI